MEKCSTRERNGGRGESISMIYFSSGHIPFLEMGKGLVGWPYSLSFDGILAILRPTKKR